MKTKKFTNDELAKIISNLTPESAMKIAKGVIESCSKSSNYSAAITLHNDMSRTDGLPCLVSIGTPIGCYCIVPPGGDC